MQKSLSKFIERLFLRKQSKNYDLFSMIICLNNSSLIEVISKSSDLNSVFFSHIFSFVTHVPDLSS